MMKRAFSTVACMDADWRTVVEAAVAVNMCALEIRLTEDGRVFGLDEEELEEFLRELQKHGIRISDLGTSVAFFDYEPEKIQKAKEGVKMAVRVEAQAIRVFLTPFEKRFSVPAIYCYEGIVKALKELAQYALQYHVEIWIETHNEFSTGESLKKLLADVDCENVKVIWDIIHPLERGEKPQETIQYLGDRICHVHIKDGKKTMGEDMIDYVYTELGQGEVPVRDILDLLKKTDYRGYLSLEWENQWRPELKGIYRSLDELLQDFNQYMDCMEGR